MLGNGKDVLKVEGVAVMEQKKTVQEIVGERLLFLRKKERMSQEDVSDMLRVARTTYAGYESGNRKMNFEHLVRIAEIFDVSLDYLFGRTDNPVREEVSHNLAEVLEVEGLHWDGMPLTQTELLPTKQFYEILIRERLAKNNAVSLKRKKSFLPSFK